MTKSVFNFNLKILSPASVCLLFAVYIVLFFFLSDLLGYAVKDLFTQAGTFAGWGLQNYFLWSPEGNLRLWIMGEISSFTSLIILCTLLISVLIAYFSKEKYQCLISVISAAILFCLVYSLDIFALFFLFHYFAYLSFHGPISKTRYAKFLKIVVAQSPLLFLFGLAITNVMIASWSAPLGILLFCWQWMRLLVYYMDDRDGLVPADLSFLNYLSVFVSPGSVINLPHTFYIGQGYKYVTDSYSYENRDQTILSGIKLMLVSLIYVLIGPFLHRLSVILFMKMGHVVSPTVEELVKRHVNGESLNGPTILISCILGQLHWFVFYAAAVHFRIGIWRLFGYNFDPHFKKPWLATNLISLWERYSYHLRLTLIRVSFFPVFLKLKKLSLLPRTAGATIASAGIANMLWVHVPMYLLTYGVSWGSLEKMPTWPYYLLLTSGIVVTEIYLLNRRKKRKAWQMDRWFVVDVFCVVLTITYFSLIHVFARPVAGGNVVLYSQLFLKGLGL